MSPATCCENTELYMEDMEEAVKVELDEEDQEAQENLETCGEVEAVSDGGTLADQHHCGASRSPRRGSRTRHRYHAAMESTQRLPSPGL